MWGDCVLMWSPHLFSLNYMKPQLQTNNPVLVFNRLKRLIAVFRSETAAAKAFGVSSVSVHYAVTGDGISCNNLYFRKLYDCVEITIDTLENLNLKDYDAMCGLKRKYYDTGKMSRKGMKYKKHTL